VTAIIVLLFLACIPICHAITRARRSGYHGLLGFTVWLLEAVARESYALAGGARKFAEGREAARRQWIEEVE